MCFEVTLASGNLFRADLCFQRDAVVSCVAPSSPGAISIEGSIQMSPGGIFLHEIKMYVVELMLIML